MTSMIKVLSKLNSLCGVSFVEKWDNVGLLANKTTKQIIKTILVTNDLTENVMEEALEIEADLIISYHPVIFKSIKSIDTSYWKNRVVTKCLANSISIYSPHTGLDNILNGVNDWLISCFGVSNVRALSKNKDQSKFSEYIIDVSEQNLLKLNLDYVNWRVLDQDLWLAKVTDDRIGDFEKLFPSPTSYEKAIHCGENSPGSGRIGSIESHKTLADCIELFKSHLHLKSIRLSLGKRKNLDSKVSCVAVCAGSGGSFVTNDQMKFVDLFVTGEASHHELLDFQHMGVSVITVGHTNSERGYLKGKFIELLKSSLPEINIKFSEKDCETFINL